MDICWFADTRSKGVVARYIETVSSLIVPQEKHDTTFAKRVVSSREKIYTGLSLCRIITKGPHIPDIPAFQSNRRRALLRDKTSYQCLEA